MNETLAAEADTEPSPTGRPWPTLGGLAYHGLAGHIVDTILPHTEADPAAMLFTLYSAAGAMIGKGPHILTGGVHHGARVWSLIIGRTAGGVKGTSYAETRRVFRYADETFSADRVMSGLSSAEGLITQVRDPHGDPDSDNYDEGVEDKRLLIIESEFASVLAQGKREGNTLLPLIRQAWDGGTLRTMTVKPKVATEPHIGIVGHITPTELRVKLNEAERAGGTMNRFLPVLSRRSKLLPDGGELVEADLKALGTELAAVIDKARGVGRMRRSVAAAEHWREVYARLAADHAGDGPVAQVVARAAPRYSACLSRPHFSTATTTWTLPTCRQPRPCGTTPKTPPGTCSAGGRATRISTDCGPSSTPATAPGCRVQRSPRSASAATRRPGRSTLSSRSS